MRTENTMSSDQTVTDARMNGNQNGQNVTQSYIRLQQSQKVRKIIQNISQLLNTGLSAETLDICIQLCEAGVHPQALAEIVNSVQSEMNALNRENF